MASTGNLTMHRQLFNPTLGKTIDGIYITLSVAIIVCNSITCLIFYKDKSLRKPFNILLLNLSLADLSSAFTIQPYIWIDFTKLGGNNAAGFLCASSVGLVFSTSTAITNILTLSAITVIRYLGIVRNYQGRLATSNSIVTSFCAMTWVIGAVTIIPSALSFKYNEFDSICYRKWPKGTNGALFSLVTTLMFMIIPTVTMVICYTALVVHIWKRSLGTLGWNIAAVRARKRVAVLLGLLILAYILCWTPFFTNWILGRVFNYFPDGADGEYERQRWLRVAAIFTQLNSVIDPFIYTFSTPAFRKGTMQLITALWRRKNLTRSARAYTVNRQPAQNVETN